MIRFTVEEPETWSRTLDGGVELCVEFNEETTLEITRQVCGREDVGNLRACSLAFIYYRETETVVFTEAALVELDEDGDWMDRPFGNSELAEEITFTLNAEEQQLLREMFPEIEKQIEENEKRPYVPQPESEWDTDYLR